MNFCFPKEEKGAGGKKTDIMVRCYVRTKTPGFITYYFPCLFVFFFCKILTVFLYLSLSAVAQPNYKMFGIVKNMCQRRDKVLKMSPVAL